MEIQPEPTLIVFARYNKWANQQALSICMNLDEALLTANIEGTVGSIRQTFGHILCAEAGFLQRIHGTHPKPDFEWNENPDVAQMAAYAAQLGDVFLETVQHIAPTENVHEENEVWSFDYQARLIFMSLIYHGIAHRTDITSFLSSQGVSSPELDIWGYQEAYPEQFRAKLVKLADN
ncbi:MAG: DinB family protein [Anaerolineae bacterium]|nr:DinB family protein [Anaerolineae bacterium]